ncbi:F-box protein SKIP19-like isoform X2 [Tasmannia lanceolata]|uniref:F-box protein SKIP19-like isoform X2 n=1 Tax=Tasmannia lanceolata TaxID=3420 RepID=UPI0040648A9E
MASVAPDDLGEVRNWAELPLDILSLIFKKLGSIEVLFTAQAVCSSWMRFSYEPQVWHCIEMLNNGYVYDLEYDLEKMARSAVDRSRGQLVEFSVEYFGTDQLLQYVADSMMYAKRCGFLLNGATHFFSGGETTSRSPSRTMRCFCNWTFKWAGPFKCLRLVSCYHITDEGLIEAAKKFPLLEELEISYCSFSEGALEAVGQLCPQLKCLKLNCRGCKGIECDEEALAIAKGMPKLCHLQLFGNHLTNDGLQAILDGCRYLVSLDLRQCFNVNLEGSLQKRCMVISDLRLPNDSTDDYGFNAEIGNDDEDYPCDDEDYPSGFSDLDILSGDEFNDYTYDESDDYTYDSADSPPLIAENGKYIRRGRCPSERWD